MKFVLMAVFLLISMVFLCNTFFYAQNSLKDTSRVFSKEQIAKQNILTLFRWIENGSLEKKEAKNAIAVIKKQLKVLKKECVLHKKPYAVVYGYLDNAFLNILARDYEFEGNNRLLLNRLFIEAAGKVNIAKARHPWLDNKNNLLDCLENEVIICCGAFTEAAKTDLSKPEILVAPSINSVVSLVEGTFSSIFKNQVSLSGAYRLVHKGSTARGTSLDNTDFDFDLLFENQKDADIFLKKLPLILEVLTRRWQLEGCKILSRNERQVLSKRLTNFIIQDKDGIVLMIQIFVGKNFEIYVDRLNAQIEQIKALGGRWEDLKGQIILFKKLVRDVLHGYRKSLGGLDGMECEQFIVQADSSSEYGRKITSIGSFDKTMRWIYDIGFDRTTNQAGIYFQDKNKTPITCTPSFWNKLVNASRKYVELAKTDMSEDEFASLGY